MEMVQSRLRKNVIWEYGLVFLTVVIGYGILPYLMERELEGNTGLDGIGQALGFVIIVRFVRSVLAVVFFVLNPIRIFVQYRNDFKGISSNLKRLGSICLVGLPVLLSVFIVFEVAIDNLAYDWKYNRGEGAYAAKAENYRSPEEFFEELESRGLLFEKADEVLLERLNQKYGVIKEELCKYYYTPGDMMALSDPCFYDTFKGKKVVDRDAEYTEAAPYYLYNAILTLPDGDEKLRYAPIARYDEQNSLSDNHFPYFKDCYIECKIFYVDGEIYALIGVSENYHLGKNFDIYDKPYYVILSEKDTITTYVDGKYCPNGAIQNQGWRFEMVPNTAKKSWAINYRVRKVDRLDVDAINTVAAQIQQEYLSESDN